MTHRTMSERSYHGSTSHSSELDSIVMKNRLSFSLMKRHLKPRYYKVHEYHVKKTPQKNPNIQPEFSKCGNMANILVLKMIGDCNIKDDIFFVVEMFITPKH